MRIEEYFLQIQKIVEACPITQLSNVTYDKRGTHEGFIKGKLQFIDNSTLHWREFVDVEITVDCFMYVYQYMDPSDMLIFRYDNTGHHKKSNLSTYPHHKHERSDNNVIPSAAKDLTNILNEIEFLVKI